MKRGSTSDVVLTWRNYGYRDCLEGRYGENDTSNAQHNLAEGETGVAVMPIWLSEKTRGLAVLRRGARQRQLLCTRHCG